MQGREARESRRSRRGGAREHARRRGGGSSGGWLRMQRWAEVWAPPPFIREIPHSLMCNHCGFNSFSEGYLRKHKKKHTTIDTTKIVLNQSWELISFLIVSKLVFCLWLVFFCLCFSACACLCLCKLDTGILRPVKRNGVNHWLWHWADCKVHCAIVSGQF